MKASSSSDRKARVLEATWDLIAEHGSETFSISDVASRASVSTRTIYNQFSDKNNLLAAAASQNYGKMFGDLSLATSGSRNLSEALAMIDQVCREIARVRAWSASAARLYFSADTNPRIIDLLREMPLLILKSWLRSDEADFSAFAIAGKDDLQQSYANAQWGLTHDWACGRMSLSDLSRAMKTNLVTIALAFGNAAGRARAASICQAII